MVLRYGCAVLTKRMVLSAMQSAVLTAYVGISLRACYAVRGTETAYDVYDGMRRAVQRQGMARY
eukprot:332028-Rhodomonas_salina.3